mmetsp:Transcript_85037/g.264196  ORF Transcript_85037/g.264196 Transcript_85037/m.264196 type:complete len:510 (-) Transcript_85037:94-1623(-)
MFHLRLAALCSALLLRPRLGHAHGGGLGDAAVLVQQEVSQHLQHRLQPHAERPDKVSCTPVPGPLHYEYGKYKGAYGTETVLWTEEEFHAVPSIGRKGAYEQLVPLMKKLKRGETLRVVIFGGSSTAGAHCKQHRNLHAKECAWPRRFQHWLEQAFPEGTVELTNFAQGAATSSSILAGAGLMLQAFSSERKGRNKGADIIFVDTLVNDVYQVQKDWGREQSEVGSLVDVDTNGAIAYEQLLRTLHKLQPQAVIFPVLSGCSICKMHGFHHREVIEKYKLPFLDWSDFVQWKQHLWDGPDVHPNYWYHQSLADVLAKLWSSTWGDRCPSIQAGKERINWRSTYYDKALLDAFQPCLEPLSAYDASVPETTSGAQLGIGWELTEDRPGKPGWISEKAGARMAFPVRFGKHPVLVITWMRSYENMGYATMKLNDREYRLDGLWTEALQEKVTLAYTRWLQVDRPSIQVGPEEVGVAGFNIGPGANLTLLITNSLDHKVEHPKMKILQVFTC